MYQSLLILALLLTACEDPLSASEVRQMIAEQEAAQEQPGECTPAQTIETWTVRVVENGCIIVTYSWDVDMRDWQAYDKVDREFSHLKSYMHGWAAQHNHEHGTEYAVQYRRHV